MKFYTYLGIFFISMMLVACANKTNSPALENFPSHTQATAGSDAALAAHTTY